MNPAEHLFKKHWQLPTYEIGELKGQWGSVASELLSPSWPIAFFWVAAAPRSNRPGKYVFRFDFSGYPVAAPTASPWDVEKNERLSFDKWPTGGGLVVSVFRSNWNGGNSLYAPCDRLADLPGHANWASQHPRYYWKSGFTFITYLEFLHDILNSGDYAYA